MVRDVPDDVHAALQRKAQLRHQSLQQYLAVELRQLAERRSINDILDEAAARKGGRVGFQTAVDILRQDRAEH